VRNSTADCHTSWRRIQSLASMPTHDLCTQPLPILHVTSSFRHYKFIRRALQYNIIIIKIVKKDDSLLHFIRRSLTFNINSRQSLRLLCSLSKTTKISSWSRNSIEVDERERERERETVSSFESLGDRLSDSRFCHRRSLWGVLFDAHRKHPFATNLPPESKHRRGTNKHRSCIRDAWSR